MVDVGVLEHDHRVVSPQLQHRVLQRPRAPFAHLTAGLHRPGEEHLGHTRGDDRLASARPVDDPQQSLRESRALEGPPDPLADQRRERRGLQHDAVACHQRLGDLSKRNAPGIVEGRDHPDHAQRLVNQGRPLGLEVKLAHGYALVGEDLLALSSDPVQRVDRREHLHRDRLVARLALLTHDQVADLVGLVDDHLGHTLEVARAVGERQLSPKGLYLGSRPHDRVDLLGRRDRDRSEPLAGGGVKRFELGGCHGHRPSALPRLRRISSSRSRNAASASSGSYSRCPMTESGISS